MVQYKANSFKGGTAGVEQWPIKETRTNEAIDGRTGGIIKIEVSL